jgi:hypothetical protein
LDSRVEGILVIAFQSVPRQSALSHCARLKSRDGINWQREMTLPLDGARIAQLFDYITRGLVFRHFGLRFPARAPSMITAARRQIVSALRA